MTVAVPTDFANLEVWLQNDPATMFTDAGVTPVASDGDLVYQWNDKSGNNRHYVQATSGNRPLYKTNRINSLPAVLFDATDDYMTNGYGPGHPYTVILVSARRGTSITQRVLNGSAANWLIGYWDTAGTIYDGFYNGAWKSQTGHTAPLNTFKMLAVRAGASGANNGSNFIADRIDWTQDGTAGPNVPGNIVLGGGGGGSVNNAANADVVEVMIFSRCLSRKEINQLEDYVAVRYGIFPQYRLVNGVIGCCQFFQANTGITLVSGKVSQWDDQSGFGHHMTQTTAAWRPSIASADLNGADAIVFGGSPIFLFLAPAMAGSFSWHEAEIHALLRADADPNTGAKTGLWELGNVASSTHYPFTDGHVYDSAARGVRYDTGDPTLSLSSAYRLYSISSADSVGGVGRWGTDGKWRAWYDGGLHYTSSVDGNFIKWNPTNALGISVAGDEFWGKCASFAVFNRQLDVTEQGLVQSAMSSANYPIALPLPPTPSSVGRSFCAGLIG